MNHIIFLCLEKSPSGPIFRIYIDNTVSEVNIKIMNTLSEKNELITDK